MYRLRVIVLIQRFYSDLFIYNSDKYYMKTKEAQQTKQTLNDNKDSFRRLETNVEKVQDEFVRKIVREINALDKQQQKQLQEMKAKRRTLALKGELTATYISDEKSPLQVPVDGQMRAGTMVFMKNCASCHSMEAVDVRSMIGPSLGLIYNRRAGSNTNYQTYSKRLLESTFFWSAKNLYKFMVDASSLVPQTTCWLRKNPIHSQQDRADLITMFREFTEEMVFNVRMKEIQRLGYTAYQTQLYVEQAQRQRGNLRDEREAKIQKPF